MAELVFQHAPNQVTQVIPGADTGWHKVTPPSGVPVGPGPNVTIAACNSGSGGLILFDFNLATTPTNGFPMLVGTTDVFGFNTNIWYKFTNAADTLYLLWAW